MIKSYFQVYTVATTEKRACEIVSEGRWWNDLESCKSHFLKSLQHQYNPNFKIYEVTISSELVRDDTDNLKWLNQM